MNQPPETGAAGPSSQTAETTEGRKPPVVILCIGMAGSVSSSSGSASPRREIR
jgi:hypothetical protein